MPMIVKFVPPAVAEFCSPQASLVGNPLVKNVVPGTLPKLWQLS
jgi:hypothetical protein